MGTLRDIKRQASQEARQCFKAERKNELLTIIADLQTKYAGHPDILVKMCSELNNEGIRTLRGLEWNPKGLWAFINQNPEISEEAQTRVPVQQSMREGVQRILDLSLELIEVADFLRWASEPEGRKMLLQEFMDAQLMTLVDKKMQLDGFESRSDLLDRLLRDYLSSRKKD